MIETQTEILLSYLKQNNIIFTKIETNSICELCYDYYIKEVDYIKYSDKLEELTNKTIKKTNICGIIFYHFPDEFYSK